MIMHQEWQQQQHQGSLSPPTMDTQALHMKDVGFLTQLFGALVVCPLE